MNLQKDHRSKSFFLKGASSTSVLLLHGWTSPPDEFLPLAKHLNSFGYTVSAPLLSGHGTKPEDLKGVTWKEWLKDSREALDSLKKQSSQIFVGGISMGGNLAMLVSVDPAVAGIISLGAPIRFRFQNLAKIGLALMGRRKTYRHKYYPPRIKKLMGDRKVYLYYPVESAKEVIRLAEATEKFLPQITKPILVMQSKTDHMVSKNSPQMIFDEVKSKTKEIFWIEKAYHVFVDDKKVWEKIGEFILRIASL